MSASLLLNPLLARDANADVNRARENLRVSGARLRCNRISTDAPETGHNRPVSFLGGTAVLYQALWGRALPRLRRRGKPRLYGKSNVARGNGLLSRPLFPAEIHWLPLPGQPVLRAACPGCTPPCGSST